MDSLPLLYPPLLKRVQGATIGLVAPASPPLKQEEIPQAIARFEAEGFRIKPGKYFAERDGYLAGSDRERAADFNALFADPEIDAIFALRGGYGSCRILPLIDYAAIRKNPKPFIGYSDITALHQAILKEAGLVTFHGPNAMEAFLPDNASALRRALTEPATRPIFFRDGETSVTLKTVVPGRARGKLVGGNMTCLTRLIGTPYAPDFCGAILFLEDTGEKAYRIDGMFTQLRLAGALSQIGGLVLGRFDHGDEMECGRIEDCLQCEAEKIGAPCVSGAPIGHFPGQIVVPHGVMAELDADAGSLNPIGQAAMPSA